LNDEITELQDRVNKLEEGRAPPPDVPGADREELLRLLDRRQNEINHLMDDWNKMSEKLKLTANEKQQIQLQLDKVVSEETSFQLKEKVISKEKTMLQQQNEWLMNELEIKNSELFSLKKDSSTSLSDKEIKLSTCQQELSNLQSIVSAKNVMIQELQGRVDSAHKRLMEVREEQANVEDKLRQELSAQTKLATLYQSASEDGEKIMKELIGKMELLQQSMEQLLEEKETMTNEANELNQKLVNERTESQEQIKSLEMELTRANDLLSTARHKGFLPLTEDEILSVSSSATATSSRLLSGLTLTQIYSRYVDILDELRATKDENSSLNNYLTQIMEELDEKTPALQRLRRDHDSLLKKCQEQQDKLVDLANECEMNRLEYEESLKTSKANDREIKRLKSLVGDLSRQVKVLLKECEEARGGVVSTSHDWSLAISSDDVSSSSQVISEHLVTFKSIEDLQEQNKKLLAVVRDLSETREEEERQADDKVTNELMEKLDGAVRELNLLKESREREKEIVKSLAQQRDMYKLLLAQSTPLPPAADDPNDSWSNQANVSRDSVVSLHRRTTEDELQELKDQFEIYKKEKAKNDEILQEQISHYREEASGTRLDSIKLTSKLEYANERYQLLETSYKGLNDELSGLKNKEKILTTTLSKHQVTIDNLTKELLTAKEKLSHTEVKNRSLKIERDSLSQSEKRYREQYEHLLSEQKSQNVLLTNLQTIQVNLEKNDYETKFRFTSRIESLEKELVLMKEKLHNEEERREKLKDAYEIQVKDLSTKLLSTQSSENELIQSLHLKGEELKDLREELSTVKTKMTETTEQLSETSDRLRAMEDDAGAEFKAKLRLLEHKLTESNNKVSSLEQQLEDALAHSNQYKSMSEANEVALQELNGASNEFREKATKEIESLQRKEKELMDKYDMMKEEKEKIEHDLRDELRETQEALLTTQEAINGLHEKVKMAEESMTEAKNDQILARQDSERCSEEARRHQDQYQRELVQHGQTMEQLSLLIEKERERNEELRTLRDEIAIMREEMESALAKEKETETRVLEEKGVIDERCQRLTQQNTILHDEIQKLSAKITTLTDSSGEIEAVVRATVVSDGVESTTPTDDQLYEVIRFMRREKEIAETKMEMAESEKSHLLQTINRLEQQLVTANDQLKELGEVAKATEETAADYEDILNKVQMLNVLTDSNKLLREEKDGFLKEIKDLKKSVGKYEQQIQSLTDLQRTLISSKDSLLAEKLALKNEVDRWSTRTNQLIEQYNKIDPDEYKQLVEEKSLRENEMSSLRASLEMTVQQKIELQGDVDRLKESVEEMTLKDAANGEEMTKKQDELNKLNDDISEKNKLIGKLKELGRKYRSMSENYKKKIDELTANVTELNGQLEEARQAPPVSNEQETTINELQTNLNQLKTDHEQIKATLADKEEKLEKVVKTARTLKTKFDTTKKEKDTIEKELEEMRVHRDQLNQQVSDLAAQETANVNTTQVELDNLQQKYDADIKKMQERIDKLEQELRSSKASTTKRRVVQPTIVLATESPSTTSTVVSSVAPTAAVKPTVTTTPTASIRPMPLHTTTAPTAHVTPTQVTTSIPSVSESMPSQSSGGGTVGSATVFVRSTSPLVVSNNLSSAPSSSSGTNEEFNRSTKRTRESLESDHGPVTKRVKQVIEAEPSTTSDYTHPVDTPTEVTPDTQTEQEVTPPLSDDVPSNDVGVADEDIVMTTDDDQRRVDSVEPEMVADTTSDDTAEETHTFMEPTSIQPDETDPQVTMVATVMEQEVAMVTGSSSIAEEDIIIIESDQYINQEAEGFDENEVREEEMREEDDDDGGEGVVNEEDDYGINGSDDEQQLMDEEVQVQEIEVVDPVSQAFVIDEQSMGLPDDEITVEIPVPSSSNVDQSTNVVVAMAQPTVMDTNRRLRLALSDRTTSSANSMGNVLDVTADDHQVPCTPILAEDKQLGKTLSVPGPVSLTPSVSSGSDDRSSVDHVVSTDAAIGSSSQVEGISSIGETRLDELSSTTQPFSPSGADVDKCIDSQLSSEYDDIIEEIINQESSDNDDDDIEEGELQYGHQSIEDGSQPSSSLAPPTSQEDSSKRRIKPIVWDQPSTSGQPPVSQRPNKPSGPPRRQIRPNRGGRGKGSRGVTSRKW
jgi:nucleoprotein TPR